jgi:RecA-family ATPase
MVNNNPISIVDELEFDRYGIDGGYEIYELKHNISLTAINIRQKRQGLEAEIGIDAPDYHFKKENIILHLQDYSQRKKLALELAGQTSEPLPWDKLLDALCEETVNLSRQLSEIQDVNAEPSVSTIEYEFQGIAIPKNLPSTIFAPGGKGKTTFASFLAVIYEYGIAPTLPITPSTGHVLYLDYESDIEVMRKYFKAIRAGLDLTDHREIAYQFCERPLLDIIDSLRTLIKNRGIELVIIDSQMAATAGGSQYMNEAEKASEYYNCLRSLKCTTITLDHVTKESMKSQDTNGTSSPYGSIVKYNRAKSIYELRSVQDTDSDHLEFALIHQKFNLGRKQKPMGIAIDFENNGDELCSIKFSECELADNPELAKTLPVKTRIFDLLLHEGLKTVEEISEDIGIGHDTAKTTLNRNKNMFMKNGNTWGVLSRSKLP